MAKSEHDQCPVFQSEGLKRACSAAWQGGPGLICTSATRRDGLVRQAPSGPDGPGWLMPPGTQEDHQTRCQQPYLSGCSPSDRELCHNLVGRHANATAIVVVRGVSIGGSVPIIMAGPCSIESRSQLAATAECLAHLGPFVLRGGAFKPRTSPYSFQGLGREGLILLKSVAQRYGLPSITEVLDPRDVDLVSNYADILQIGTRNMYNSPLLREVGRSRLPVMLKRGFSATLEEWLSAAEYILLEGNSQVLLCERGIRTFESATRNTLDISAIALARLGTSLPIIADVSHAAGRTDLALPLAKAALAAGAHGIMVEVHPNPAAALSDSQQQLNLHQFAGFVRGLDLPSFQCSPHLASDNLPSGEYQKAERRSP